MKASTVHLPIHLSPEAYSPPAWQFNGDIQTIFPALFRKVNGFKYERERISTPDNDFLDLDWAGEESKNLVILCHGLEGDSHRPYIKGMVRAFINSGWKALAWNFRGCSGEPNKLLRFYHSGATDDLETVVNYALGKHTYKNIFLIGFSLGGNLVLKYLGERAENVRQEIIGAFTYSVPLDLYNSLLQISKRRNFIYSQRFLTNLKRKIREKARLMPQDLDVGPLRSIRDLHTFDDLYTSVLHGFADARDYYRQCSSLYFLQGIKVPTFIINAENDPFLSKTCYPEEEVSKMVTFLYPKEGGHCGFALPGTNTYWSEQIAVALATQLL